MQNKRSYHYDYMRAICAIFVITIHVTDIVLSTAYPHGKQWIFGTIVQMIVRTGLPVFFMLSGALILNAKDEDIVSFYIKRISKILIPLFLYSYFYLFMYNYKWSIFNPQNFLYATKSIINGPVYYHLWFVYALFGIYLCAPFLKVLVKNLNDRNIIIFILVILFIRTNANYFSVLGIGIGISNFNFSDWIMYFLLGYMLTRPVFLNHKVIIYSMAIMAFITTFIILRFYPALSQNIFDLAPTMILMSSGFFMLFESNKSCFSKKYIISNLVSITSRYSYSIYLIHAFVLQYIVNERLKINAVTWNPIVGTVITVLITFVISIILAIIIDLIFTKNAIKLFELIHLKLKNKKKLVNLIGITSLNI